MALFPNTLTLIFSDHGHKMTPFICTERGRRELFDPAFFMIVPDDVKEKLGPDGSLDNKPKAHIYVV